MSWISQQPLLERSVSYLRFRLSTLFVLITAVSIPLALAGDVFGGLVIAAMNTIWWWLVLPSHFKDRRTADWVRICYFGLVTWAAFDFDTLFSTFAQPFAFAGLVATALQIPQLSRLKEPERACCLYSLAATSLAFLSGYFLHDEETLGLQILLLAIAVVFWVHIRLNAFRRKPIRWLQIAGSVLFWFGSIPATAGLVSPIFLSKAWGLEGVAVSVLLWIAGFYGTLAMALAVVLELISTPAPRLRRICFLFGIGLLWILLCIAIFGI